jgi:hypothetical protein
LHGLATLGYRRRVKAAAEPTADATTQPATVTPVAPLTLAAAAELVVDASRGRAVVARRQAAALQLQRTHGNAALSGWLARKPAAAPAKPLPPDSLLHGLGSAALVSDDVEATLYDAPDTSRPAVGKLTKDQAVTLIGTAGDDFLIVEVDGQRAYVKNTGIATAVDTPGAKVKEDWDKKLREMSERLDKSGHTGGAALSGGGGMAKASSGPHAAFSAEFMTLQNRLSLSETWDQELEDAQALLRDYALWYFASYHSTPLPPNVRIFFDYVGRSTKNAAAADKLKVKSTRHMGGYIENGQRSIDWCTQSTSTAVMDALKESGTGVDFGKLQAMLPKAQGNIGAPAAYTAPLMPGDMVMYLFKGCQFGGHAVTVIDDLGDSFTHVSGNSTNAGVMMGEEKRMTTLPKGPEPFVLSKATPGPVYTKDDPKKIDKDATKKAHDDASAYLRKFDAGFGDAALVYSIVRYGSLLNGLTAPKPKASSSSTTST